MKVAAAAVKKGSASHAAEAIRGYAMRLDETNVGACCGGAERVVRALVREKSLPGNFIFPNDKRSQVRDTLRSMQSLTHFTRLEHWAMNGKEETTYTMALAVAGQVGKALAVAEPGTPLHGRTPRQWAEQVIRPIVEKVAQKVEAASSEANGLRFATECLQSSFDIHIESGRTRSVSIAYKRSGVYAMG